ncbi:hypothetical protein MLD38_026362 [Melastoma candidum]|uniref:Uncharacterized protein n=1 Tax=Melastoma candidum TaxID=119954 RepID=A0ACB9NY49_9MYRT|nr:hypothetical protein MLD38_026362 [Melastoma candidum]
MEGGSVSAYKAIRSCWRRRGYVRLPTRTGRFWRLRVRVSPKLKVSKLISSPKKALLRLRDGYVGMMLGLASTSICTRGSGYHHSGAGCGFGKAPLKEYNRKVIAEICRSVVMAAAAADDGKLGK